MDWPPFFAPPHPRNRRSGTRSGEHRSYPGELQVPIGASVSIRIPLLRLSWLGSAIMDNETVRELLAKALKRQNELRSEFDALLNLISHYQQHLSGSPSSAEDQPSLDLRTSSVKARSAYVARVMEEARRLILEARRPLKRGELV